MLNRRLAQADPFRCSRETSSSGPTRKTSAKARLSFSTTASVRASAQTAVGAAANALPLLSSDIPLSEQFRRQYSTLWRSIFVLDLPAIGNIAREWGIDFDTDLFAR